MSHISFRLVVATLGLLLTATVGCFNLGEGTQQRTRFYVLHSLSDAGTETQAPENDYCAAIGIGPVRFPEYLNRPQIVTRVSQNELHLAMFDKWAEPLKDNFSRVLAENLSSLLRTKSVVVFPWGQSIPIDYRVEVEVIRMDGNLGGNATLVARWVIYDEDNAKVLMRGEGSYSEPAVRKNYEAQIAAQSRTLATLSRDIAQALKALFANLAASKS